MAATSVQSSGPHLPAVMRRAQKRRPTKKAARRTRAMVVAVKPGPMLGEPALAPSWRRRIFNMVESIPGWDGGFEEKREPGL